MMNKPAHKNLDNPPGQIVTSPEAVVTPGFDRYPYLPKSNMLPKTLGDMIDDVKKHEEMLMNQKKKLTFDEWLSHRFPAGFEEFDGNLDVSDLEQCWKAAKEDM